MSDSDSNNNPLANLSIATLRILKKVVEDACDVKGRREQLGQAKAEFAVRETLTLDVAGLVKVGKSSPNAIIAQSAKPWDLFAVALTEANKQLAAAGVAGIDLKRVVELAEGADKDLVKRAKDDTKKALTEIKDEVRAFRWGAVRVDGTVTKVTAPEAAPANLFGRPPADDDGEEGAA